VAIISTTMRPLLAGTLGVAGFGSLFSEAVLCAPPSEQMQHEIVVTAARHSDAAMTAQVTAALQQDPYIFSDHVTVTTENGVVRVGGIVRDLSDLFAILRLAHRIAGKARVVDEIEFVPVDDDGN
jgi:osmotically-inducible protein OsmY